MATTRKLGRPVLFPGREIGFATAGECIRVFTDECTVRRDGTA
jgi:hypothetical protein